MIPIAVLPYLPLIGKVLIVAAAAGGLLMGKSCYDGRQQDIGAASVQAKWDAREKQLADAALVESESRARESLRRIEAQKRNQDAQDQALAALAADRDRAELAADRMRRDATAAASGWAARLADSPTREDLAAAAAAIGVCTELRERADRRAGILAAYADAARAHGLKCEADYDSLTTKEEP